MTLRRVAIIGGNRIPFARANGPYARASNQAMLTAALEGLIERFNLHGERLGEVVAGAVLKDARDFSLTRECVLGSRLSPQTPAYDLQQACGTGLEAALLVANKIALGQIECAVAGGVDTTSDVPIGLNDGLRQWLLQLNRTKAPLDKLKAVLQLRPQFLKPAFPRNGEPRTGLSMGQHCELMAQTWHIPRADQDALALYSHQALATAYHEGWEDDLVTPFLGLTRDNNLRTDLTLEKLAALKPVFERSAKGTLTAGNSTPLTDGASVVLLGSEAWAKARGLPILAYLRDGETAAVDFVHGAEGLLMAPVYAVPRLLARNGLSLQDFDYYEIHEAFAAQVLCTLKAWEDPEYCKTRLGLDAPLGAIDRSKLNVKGSSLAAGHPFAATGGRIVANLAKLLDAAGQGRGLISICAAGGQGVTAIIER
ncbi:acetyl-CoA acetyltransferase [Pseudomonas lundensis]|uniref:acetyl-CoA C-acetyltransferase n=1 Tax=Pseudomonas lundensis TaxID=86185 RepID=UPI0006422BBF|nr:acetyl-CoA C-acetyltransferase [Pseudomonas lundensis]AOZ13532.1 acetyl-CoA acetyltransferase [Pseudomonas lundensis]QVQ79245.1 acetyl-CoA C-acetyltransferase [Pseudomonas lundensis]QVQ81696.1 acetyl-CoA C-acetyltransferase [Pseudomonas lundensis]